MNAHQQKEPPISHLRGGASDSGGGESHIRGGAKNRDRDKDEADMIFGQEVTRH